MKIFGSGKAAFVCRVVLVCVIFALTLAACISGALAVSGDNVETRYLPDVAATVVFKVTLTAAIAVSVLLLFVPERRKADLGNKKSVGEETVDTESDAADKQPLEASDTIPSSSSRATRTRSAALIYTFLVSAICSLYVFIFALTDESLGSWGNAVMITALITALFFLSKISPRFPIGTVVCGFGAFAFASVVIASLYLDHVIEINSDFKLLVQFGAAGLIISVIADIRRAFSRISARWFIPLKMIAFIICSVCPAVILSLPSIDGIVFPECYSAYSWLYLACAVSFALEVIAELLADRSRRI